MLSDISIREAIEHGALSITPFHDKHIQPTSYDLHLGSNILRLRHDGLIIDPSIQDMPTHEADLPDYYGPIQYINPGECVLGHTDEIVTLHSNMLSADIAGISSLGRWFLFVHVTAGFVDAGWDGQLTLELYNASPWYIRIWAGMRIAQLRLYMLEKPALKPYGRTESSHYFQSVGPVASRYKDDGYVPSTNHS